MFSIYLLVRIGSLGVASDHKSGEMWLTKVISLEGLGSQPDQEGPGRERSMNIRDRERSM